MKYNELGMPIFRRLTKKSSFLKVAATAYELEIKFKVERRFVTCWQYELFDGYYPITKRVQAEDFYMYLNDLLEKRGLIKPLEPEI